MGSRIGRKKSSIDTFNSVVSFGDSINIDTSDSNLRQEKIENGFLPQNT